MMHSIAPVVELVDAADSKSVARKGVGVRVSPGAPPVQMGIVRGLILAPLQATHAILPLHLV